MQTFLPYRDFRRSVEVLDTARLGKQRVETLQVLRALVLPDYGWQRHPVVRMWRGRVPALVGYGLACVQVWTAQGRADTTGSQIAEFAPAVADATQEDLAALGLLPRWVGDGAVHLSHRSALVRKDPGFYRPVFGDVPDDLPYVWPDADPGPGPDPAPGTGAGARAGTAGDDDRDVWVVRCEPGDEVAVPVEAPTGRRSPKHRRQVDAFVAEVAEGDLVAVPVDGGAELVVGRVAGQVRADGDRLVRGVRWFARAPRSAVRPPALLQDPRLLFRVPVEQSLVG